MASNPVGITFVGSGQCRCHDVVDLFGAYAADDADGPDAKPCQCKPFKQIRRLLPLWTEKRNKHGSPIALPSAEVSLFHDPIPSPISQSDALCRLAPVAAALPSRSYTQMHRQRRRPEKDLWQEFETAQPHLFGVISMQRSMDLRSCPVFTSAA
jgi:hypothetical protein